jgi:mycothiol synthase
MTGPPPRAGIEMLERQPAVRRYTAADLPALSELARALFPEYDDPALPWRPGQQLDNPDRTLLAYVALPPGAAQVLGYCALWEVHPSRYRLNLMVHPRWRGRGLGGHLFARLLAGWERLTPISVTARVREDQAAALGFLARRGFEEIHRMRGMVLRTAEAELSGLEARLDSLKAAGIEVTTLAEVQAQDPEWRRGLYELKGRVLPGWPIPDPTWPPSAPTYEAFEKCLQEELGPPGKLLLAMQRGRYVGMCGALGTAVAPEARGRGVATALKALYAARARGSEELLFSNSANPAIHAINRRLGYQPWHAEVRLLRSGATPRP